MDELAGVFTLVDAVGEESWHLDFRCELRCSIILDDVVAAVWDEGDSPHVTCDISPSADDGFTVETNFATVHMKPHVAPCITKNRN